MLNAMKTIQLYNLKYIIRYRQPQTELELKLNKL